MIKFNDAGLWKALGIRSGILPIRAHRTHRGVWGHALLEILDNRISEVASGVMFRWCNGLLYV